MTKIIYYIIVLGGLFAGFLIYRASDKIQLLITWINENFLTFLPPEILALIILAFVVWIFKLISIFK